MEPVLELIERLLGIQSGGRPRSQHARNRWQDLAEPAHVEMDPVKLARVATELCDELDRKGEARILASDLPIRAPAAREGTRSTNACRRLPSLVRAVCRRMTVRDWARSSRKSDIPMRRRMDFQAKQVF